MKKLESSIKVIKTRRGTKIHAKGKAAQALFDALTKSAPMEPQKQEQEGESRE